MAPGVEVAHYETVGGGYSFTEDPASSSPRRIYTSLGSQNQEWVYVAPSFDFGGQAILPLGLLGGVSVGARYRVAVGRFDESTMPFSWSLSEGAGLRPRARVWLGFAFW